MTGHDKLWLLLDDRGRQVAELDRELDLLDALVDDEQNLRLRDTRERLERLGFRTQGLRPLRRHRSEERTSRHLQPDDDVERLVAEAKTTAACRPRDPGLLHRPAIGQVLGVR